MKKSSKQTDLSIPFNAWLSAKKMTTQDFVKAADRGKTPLFLSFSTVCSWRLGHKPRKLAQAVLSAKFPGIKF